MVAIRDKRPFSLDYKLKDIESYLPDFKSIFEIRLLVVANKYRNTIIFTGILKNSLSLHWRVVMIWGLFPGPPDK